MGKEGVGIRGRVCVSVLTAGLVYHKPPSCQYYDRSRWDTVSFAQSVLGVDSTDRREGEEEEGSPLVLRTSECHGGRWW